MNYHWYEYLVFVFIFMLFACQNNGKFNKLETKEVCHFSLGRFDNKKDITVNFPFEVYDLDVLNFRCTSTEPYCHVLGNEWLEVWICHRNKYGESKCESKSFIDYKEKIEYSLNMDTLQEKRRFSLPSTFEILPIKIEIGENYEIVEYGLTQKTVKHEILMYNFGVNTQDEYFHLEFRSANEEVDFEYEMAVIDYIIEHIKGKPTLDY